MTKIRKVTNDEKVYIKENFEYNSSTGDLWRKFKNGERKICRCQNSRGYYVVSIGKKKFKAHRICYFLVHGVFPEIDIDHGDRIRTNNKIDNLREASGEENQHNRTKSKTFKGGKPSSKFKGVTAQYIKGKFYKWRARIIFKGQETYIGGFSNEEDAALAYDREALKSFGPEFSHLNFPKIEDLCGGVSNDETNFSESDKYPFNILIT